MQGIPEWAGMDSNHRATDYESAALTPELPALERNLAAPLPLGDTPMTHEILNLRSFRVSDHGLGAPVLPPRERARPSAHA